jgi:hypothetical protein
VDDSPLVLGIAVPLLGLMAGVTAVFKDGVGAGAKGVDVGFAP